MMAYEDKINGGFDFLVNKMGMESSMFARRPALLSLSLEKRIVPRCGVYQVLLSKGLIKKASSLRASLESTEKLFQNKFVNCHEEEAPELVKLYKEKLELARYSWAMKIRRKVD
ncbi:hypothetical protein LOK49_LG06G03219 [Camellia lanceoleosa]|uniref:Uncharacterized protein n=1 Tax=Camellia lanceoleosa TaxID=1840588 RepID=A0ACC0HBT8_9ERIC|nr:hypothetical protein LOK49_LG06G03219 [Camellia lanceoleosa]